MYNYIINPNTNRKVCITTKLGNDIMTNYLNHYLNQLGGASIISYTVIVTIGSIGYYYFSAPIATSHDKLEKLNEIAYLNKNYRLLAKKIKTKLEEADQIIYEIERELDDLEKQIKDISIKPEEEIQLSQELDNLLISVTNDHLKRGGAAITFIPLIIRMGLLAVSVNVSYNIWSRYLDPLVNGTTHEVVAVNITNDDDWLIVETHNSENVTINPIKALEQITKAKIDLLKRLKLLKQRQIDLKYANMQKHIKSQINQVTNQLKNILMLEKQLKIAIRQKGSVVSAKLN